MVCQNLSRRCSNLLHFYHSNSLDNFLEMIIISALFELNGLRSHFWYHFFIFQGSSVINSKFASGEISWSPESINASNESTPIFNVIFFICVPANKSGFNDNSQFVSLLHVHVEIEIFHRFCFLLFVYGLHIACSGFEAL